MAAAPHLFDDPPVASPELALVDADLAAQLRADLVTGDPFQPRDVPRAEYPTLVLDAVVRDLGVDEQDVPVDEAPLEEPVESLDEVVVLDETFVPPVLESPAWPEEQVTELPDYVVVGEDVVDRDRGDEAVDQSDLAEGKTPLVEEPVQPSDDVLPDHELLTPPLLEALAPAEEQSYQLPDYVVRPADEPAPVLPEYIAAPAELPAVDEVVVVPEVVEVSADHAATTSDYPVLPDLEERSDALEETEAALRKIREQLVPPTHPTRRPWLRRRFTIVAGLCALAAAGVAAADVQLGVAHAWLGF